MSVKLGNLTRDDLEFFTKELNYEKFDRTILITGEHNAAQDVLSSFLDTNATFHENALVSWHDMQRDKQKIDIEHKLREEGLIIKNDIPIPQGDILPDMRVSIEKLIVDWNEDEKKMLDDRLLKFMLDNELGCRLFLNSIERGDYPQEAHCYLEEVTFYCQKAREYISRVDKAQKEVDYYHAKVDEWKCNYSQIADKYKAVADSFLKILTDYGEIVQYCLDEACHWKRLAEIRKRNANDKRRIGDPSKMTWCATHIDNQAVKYVYMPADKRVIDERTIDIELVKCGVMQRDGIDASMLAVKSIDSFKDEEMKSIFDRLNTYGGDFKDRGMIVIADEEGDFDPIKDREKIEDILVDKNCPEFFREVARDLEDRIIPVHKVGIENDFVKTVNVGNLNALENHKKLIDGIKSIDEITEGRKHISEIAEVGSKTFSKLQEIQFNGQEGMKRIEEAIAVEVKETSAVVMYERVDKEKIIEEKRVEERVFEEERKDRLKIDSERKKEEERLEMVLEEMKQIRELRRQRRNEKLQQRRKKERKEDENKFKDRLEWNIINTRVQIEEKNDTIRDIDVITKGWLQDNEQNSDFVRVTELFAELSTAKENLLQANEAIEFTFNERVEFQMQELRTRWDILLLKYGEMGKLMLMGFFFT